MPAVADTASTLDALLLADHRCGEAVYRRVSGSHPLRLLATLWSLSGDEVVWFAPAGVFLTMNFALVAAQGVLHGGKVTPSGCIEQCLSDVFGISCVAGFVECVTKLVFRRYRPAYAPQRKHGDLPGETFSMPSGHSLRAGMAACWLAHNAHAALILGSFGFTAPPLWLALLWAAGVATSRCSLGKHYPLDCLIGLLLGAALGLLLEMPSGAESIVARGCIKAVCGTTITALYGFYVVVPALRAALSQRALGSGTLYAAWLAFFAAFLLARAPTGTTVSDWWPGHCAA
eukprot:TRINITY_DN32478_c0_g1_i1.p1 TRINITY_DN32478_c0_g1~~TRINITY_DN32478_c0_g1_i1.p1  ORF type:complete len:288 (+),score=45.21 TRINITY_DN32478_c0_g1_i1:108-971(+)